MARNILQRWIDRLLLRDVPLSALAEYLMVADSSAQNWDFAQFSAKGYEANPYVNACMREIVEASNAISLKLTMDDEDIEKDKMTDAQKAVMRLLKRPNPDQTYRMFLENWLIDLHLAGSAYIYKIGTGTSELQGQARPKAAPELHLLRPDMVTVYTSGGIVTHFEYIDADGKKHRLERDQVIMTRFVHPRNKAAGFAPIKAAAIVIDTHNNGFVWNNTLLKNMGLVSGIAVIKGVRNLGKEKLDKLEQDFEKKYTGPKNIGKIKVTAGDGIEYVSMGHTSKDLDWLGGKRDLMRDICAVMRTPSQLFNDPGASTYSNYQEAMRALYLKTVLPIMERFIESITIGLVGDYDPIAELELDVSAIDALRENENERVERLVKKSAWSTINEIRAQDGLDDIEGGDEILVPMNVVPLSVAAGDLDEDEPDDKSKPKPKSDDDDEDDDNPEDDNPDDEDDDEGDGD